MKSVVLRRLIAVVVMLEALYVLGLTYVLAGFLVRLDLTEEQARRVEIIDRVKGGVVISVLLLTAVGLWTGWIVQTGRRKRTIAVRVAAVLTAGMNALVMASAIANIVGISSE